MRRAQLAAVVLTAAIALAACRGSNTAPPEAATTGPVPAPATTAQEQDR